MNNILRNWYTRSRPIRINASNAKKALFSLISKKPRATKIVGDLSMRYTLKPHQRTVRNFMKVQDRLLAIHGTGSGKTLTAAHVAADFMSGNVERRIVIFVTPKAVQEQFKASVSTVLTGNPGIYFTTYNGLTDFLHRLYTNRHETMKRVVKDALIIADEAHYIRNKTENLRVFENILKDAKKVLLMTGTPCSTGQYSDLLPYAKILNPNENVTQVDGTNIDRYFGCKVSVYDVPSNNPNFPKLLPTIQRRFILSNNKLNQVSTNKKSIVEYIKYKKQLQTNGLIPKENLNRIRTAGWAYNKAIYSVKFFGNKPEPKFSAFLDIFKKRPYKTIVYFMINNNLERFASFLNKQKIEFKRVTRSAGNMRRIINDPPDKKMVYLLMPAAKEGLDFKGVRTVIFMDFPWVPSNYDQVVGRARRYLSHVALSNISKNVQVYDLMYTSGRDSSKVTMNMRSMNILTTKRTAIKTIIDKLKSIGIEHCPLPRSSSGASSSRRLRSPNRMKQPTRTISISPTRIKARSPGGRYYHEAKFNVPINKNIIPKKSKNYSYKSTNQSIGIASIL